MRKIKKMVERISEELCDAQDYAECYVEFKSKNIMYWANKYKEMAMDELKHADYIHEKAVADIEELNTVFTPTEEMEEMWEKSHKNYVEKAAWIKTMLNM